MKLADLATPIVFTVAPKDLIDRALSLMDEHAIHHLPVVEEGHVVGILSDRDLLLAVGWKLSSERRLNGNPKKIAGPMRVFEVMSKPVLCLPPHTALHTAANVMVARKIDAIPIVTRSVLMGIVTKMDLLRYFREPVRWWLDPEVLHEPVRDHMSASVVSVSVKEPLESAAALMRERRIRHLPVMTEGIVTGIVSDRDIRRSCGRELVEDAQAEATGDFYLGPRFVMDVMSSHPRTIGPNASLLMAGQEMVSHRFGALPVCEGSRLVGIITDTDLLLAVGDADVVED